MPETGYLFDVVVILLAAVVAVSIFQRLRLGAVLGYLVGGALIGPSGFGLVSNLENTQALAELGVVFLLFAVGLELPFSRIKLMRGPVFALGAAQVFVTSLAIAGVANLAGLRLQAAAIIGVGLALSSTAIVLRMLSDRDDLNSQFGRSAFAVLLLQDLMVGPFLVGVVALGQPGDSVFAALGESGLKMVAAVMAILGVGRIVLRGLFAQVAATREPEIFAALTLFIALAAGMITHEAGLSMAFGAFLAGMLLAETQFRHQVHADIQPFRGLLLGLFFMTVGMAINLKIAWENIGWILLMAAALIIGKAVILTTLARLFALSKPDSLHLGLLLSQGGEFAFVLLGAGVAAGPLRMADAQILVVAVAVTMMVTPLLAVLGRRLSQRMTKEATPSIEDIPEEVGALRDHVIIAGFGRVGNAVAQSLSDAGASYVALDLDPHRVAQARKSNQPIYYGDATRPDVLAAVNLDKARALVVAMDSPKAALQTVAMVRYIFPDIQVYARAKNEAHARELEEAGAYQVVPELVATGVKLAGSIIDSKK
ncbi:MAG: cation:proton antiporter [Pseudomonadota bacterium]